MFRPWCVGLALTTIFVFVWSLACKDLDPDEFSVTMQDFRVRTNGWTECLPPPGTFKSNQGNKLIHTPLLGQQYRVVVCRDVLQHSKSPSSTKCARIHDFVGLSRYCVHRVDCELGDWMPWVQLKNGASIRYRNIIRMPQGGGKDCGIVQEIRPAGLEPTAHWVPKPWGPCKIGNHGSDFSRQSPPDRDYVLYEDTDDYIEPESKVCGGGVQRRSVTCVHANGTELHVSNCAHLQKPTLIQPCEIPCPRDCEVGPWSEWSPCQPTDGCPLFPVQQLTTTGYSVRRRRETSAPSAGGAPCPPLEEKRSCVKPRCASWRPQPWGPCVLTNPHDTCGQGKRNRSFICVGHDGKPAEEAWCLGSTPPLAEGCRIACGGDCVLSAWGAWGECSALCQRPGLPPPTRERTRMVLAQAGKDGWPCPPQEQLVQHEVCNTHACNTYSWLATPWRECISITGDTANNYTDYASLEEDFCVEEGESYREVMCVQNNVDVVRDALCTPLKRPVSTRACTLRCNRNCVLGEWSDWSPCADSCEPQKQFRKRQVQGGPKCGESEQYRDCTPSEGCVHNKPVWKTSPKWGRCMHSGKEMCGSGVRIRSAWCSQGGQIAPPSFCAGLPVPSTIENCFTPCKCNQRPKSTNCDQVCERPDRYLDSTDIKPGECVCPNVTLQLIRSDSDCIMPAGRDCGKGRMLQASRCLLSGTEVLMAVCQKFHPLTGPKAISATASGYDLRYDKEFDGLVSMPCKTECPVDCVVGEWGQWGVCRTVPASYRVRSREVIQEGSVGGRECGQIMQKSICNRTEAKWVIGKWSQCVPENRECGPGFINATVTCECSYGECESRDSCDSPSPVRSLRCRSPCADDCVVSDWSDWSPCEQSKWGARRDRTRVILRPPSGGEECPPLVDAESCDKHAYSWHVGEWDDCQPLGSSPCGEGRKRRHIRCRRDDGLFVDDNLCPNTTIEESSESWCYVPCGVDCEVSDWTEWDASSCKCGATQGTYIRRSRESLVAAVWPGRACPSLEQRIPCPVTPCLKLISRLLDNQCAIRPLKAKPAEHICGEGGVRRSEIRCENLYRIDSHVNIHYEPWRCTPTIPGTINMPPAKHQEQECDSKCECKHWEKDIKKGEGRWSSWSICKNNTRSRTRKIVVAQDRGCTEPDGQILIEWMNCDQLDSNTPMLPTLPKLTLTLNEPGKFDRDGNLVKAKDQSDKNDEIDDEVIAVDDGDDNDDDDDRNYHEVDKDVSLSAGNDIAVYPDGYTQGSDTLLAIVWSSTLILATYGAYILYRGLLSCLRSQRMKKVTKV